MVVVAAVNTYVNIDAVVVVVVVFVAVACVNHANILTFEKYFFLATAITTLNSDKIVEDLVQGMP